MKAIIDLNKILTDIDYEIDLLPYFVKLELQNVGIPVIVDPTDVRNPDFEVEEGVLSYMINAETMIMEITYD